VERLKAELEAW